MKQDQRAITTICNTHGISFTARKIKNEGGLLYDAWRIIRHCIGKNDYNFW